MLGESGTQSHTLRNWRFVQYMRQHHASWHEHAFQKGYAVLPTDIILVSGWVKTSKWALAAFSSQERSHDITFQANVGTFASAQFALSVQGDTLMPIEQRCGPSSASGIAQTTPKKDQCLFLRYYKQKSRSPRHPKIVAAIDAKDTRVLPQLDDLNLEQCTPSRSSSEVPGWIKRLLSTAPKDDVSSGSSTKRLSGDKINIVEDEWGIRIPPSLELADSKGSASSRSVQEQENKQRTSVQPLEPDDNWSSASSEIEEEPRLVAVRSLPTSIYPH